MKTFGNVELLVAYAKISRELKKKSLEEVISKFVRKAEKYPIRQYEEKKLKRIEKNINKSLCRIEKMSSLFFLDAKCLHRVLMQYLLFRKYYCFPVKMVIGVKKFPFSSHIWLEWKSSNINECKLVCEFEENIVGFDVIFDSDKDIERA